MTSNPPWYKHIATLPQAILERLEYYPTLGIDHARAQRLSSGDRTALQYKIWFTMGVALLCFLAGVYQSGFFSPRVYTISFESLMLTIFALEAFGLTSIYVLYYSVNLGYGDGYTYLEEFQMWLPNSQLRKFYEKKLSMRAKMVQRLEILMQDCVSARERYESALSELD